MDRRTKEFTLNDVFALRPVRKRFGRPERHGGEHPYVGCSVVNNGITGHISEDESYLMPSGSLTLSQYGTKVFYHPTPYFLGSHVQVITPHGHVFDECAGLYIATVVEKVSSVVACERFINARTIKSLKITLPVVGHPDPQHEFTADDIDYRYMREYMSGIGQGCIDEIATCLSSFATVDGSDDMRGVTNVQSDTAQDECGRQEFGAFRVGDVFEKVEARCRKPDFDKSLDTSTVPDDEFCVPLVNAKLGNNGVMFYGRRSDWDTQGMCIDVIQNGAKSTGTVYAQPYPVGVLWDAYLIRPVFGVDSVECLLYLAACLEKVTKNRFSYDKKAIWDRVRECDIVLPVTRDGGVDTVYMKRFIDAIQKTVVSNVVKYGDLALTTVSR